MRRIVLAWICLAFVAGGCGGGGEGGTTLAPAPTFHPDVLTEPLAGRIPYVVDGDGAGDDLKAILYLLQQPDLALRAITMSGTGIAHCPQGAENAKAMLEMVGAPEIPVACGRAAPLQGFNTAPTDWRKGADSLGGMDLPEPGPLSELGSPELLAQTIAASPEKVVLVALGPLTNIAEALLADPSFLDNIEMVYLMGGAVDVAGNVIYANELAEFNIWADPHAAALVFESGVPITLVPLDATNGVPVTPHLYDVFAKYHDTPTSQFMHDYLAVNPLIGALYHWDELAAVIATDETVAQFAERRIRVEEEGDLDAGQTLEDPTGSPMRVAVAADRDLFEDRFYSALTGESEIDVPVWSPDVVVEFDGEGCTYHGPDLLPESFSVQLDNTAPTTYALVVGRFAAGTTAADLEAYRQSGSSQPPDFWSPVGSYFGTPDAHDVWLVDGAGPDATALCFVDYETFWHVVGPEPE